MQENNVVTKSKKLSTGMVILIILLIILLIGAAGYLIYYRVSSNNNELTTTTTQPVEDGSNYIEGIFINEISQEEFEACEGPDSINLQLYNDGTFILNTSRPCSSSDSIRGGYELINNIFTINPTHRQENEDEIFIEEDSDYKNISLYFVDENNLILIIYTGLEYTLVRS